jgi:hypothetical protein
MADNRILSLFKIVSSLISELFENFSASGASGFADGSSILGPPRQASLWGARVWRFLEWGLAPGHVDDGELAVEVVAEQPQEAFTVVEFDAKSFSFLACGRCES